MMDIIYTLAGIILIAFTCFLAWVNWRILRVSEELLVVSKILVNETIQVRKVLDNKSAIIQNTPILGTKNK